MRDCSPDPALNNTALSASKAWTSRNCSESSVGVGIPRQDAPPSVVRRTAPSCPLTQTTRSEGALTACSSAPVPLVSGSARGAWAATEICRYPLYIFGKTRLAAALRYATPVLTFPLGTGGEAWACAAALPALAGAPASRLGDRTLMSPAEVRAWLRSPGGG